MNVESIISLLSSRASSKVRELEAIPPDDRTSLDHQNIQKLKELKHSLDLLSNIPNRANSEYLK